MKRGYFVILLITCIILLSACGKTSGETNSVGAETSVTTIRVVNIKSEVGSQMTSLAKAFNSSQSNIIVEIETIPSGVDVQSTLKGYYLADNMPDIISCEAAGFAKWEGLLVDLSAEAWAKDTDAAYTDSSYGTLGFPYTTEAIGMAYNASIRNPFNCFPDEPSCPECIHRGSPRGRSRQRLCSSGNRNQFFGR